jgi:hypothetical protein
MQLRRRTDLCIVDKRTREYFGCVEKDISRPEHVLLAKSVTNSVEVSRAVLPAPGAPNAITVVAIMENETRDEAIRLQDRSLRMFDVEVLLTKQLTLPDKFNGDFTKEDGASLIKLAGTIKVDTTSGSFHVEPNIRNEMALIRMRVEAHVATEARNKVYDATSAFLDHLSYLARTPILTGLMKISDTKNDIISIEIIGPDREATLNSGSAKLFSELAPIYALYREFKNSSSSYYRLICLFKIMEGIFGGLRPKGRELANALGVPFSITKERVPHHPDIAQELRYLIRMPIKKFYDNILEKRYRDTASHFLVQENVILQVSSAEERNKFAEMTFVCDLCACVLISNHEALLRRLDEARMKQPV